MKFLFIILFLLNNTIASAFDENDTLSCAQGLRLTQSGDLLISTEENDGIRGFLPTKYRVDGTYYYVEGMFWDANLNAYFGQTNWQFPNRTEALIYYYDNNENSVSLVLKRVGSLASEKEYKFSECHF